MVLRAKVKGSSLESVIETVRFLERQGVGKPAIGMILGTGFGRFARQIEVDVQIPYNRIPHFPVSTVADHAGNLVSGRVSGKRS